MADDQSLMTMFMNDVRQGGDDLLSHDEECGLARECEAGILARWVLEGHDPENAKVRKGVPFNDESMVAQIMARIRPGESSPAADVAEHAQRRAGSDEDVDDMWLQGVVERGEASRRRMIESNIRLVVRLAASARNSRSLMDRIQDGSLGLCHGIVKYDWRSGNHLSTYIYHWILQAIQRGECNSGRLIRIPCHVDAKIRKARAIVNEEDGTTGADEAEENTDVGFDIDGVLAYEPLLNPISLDCPLSDSEGKSNTLGDVLCADTADAADCYEEEERMRLSAMVRQVSAPVLETADGRITAMLHGIGRPKMTLGEASAETGKGRKALKTADRRGLRSLAAVLEPLALASGEYSTEELSFCFE